MGGLWRPCCRRRHLSLFPPAPTSQVLLPLFLLSNPLLPLLSSPPTAAASTLALVPAFVTKASFMRLLVFYVVCLEKAVCCACPGSLRLHCRHNHFRLLTLPTAVSRIDVVCRHTSVRLAVASPVCLFTSACRFTLSISFVLSFLCALSAPTFSASSPSSDLSALSAFAVSDSDPAASPSTSASSAVAALDASCPTQPPRPYHPTRQLHLLHLITAALMTLSTPSAPAALSASLTAPPSPAPLS